MKGFTHTGRGPKAGHDFSKAGAPKGQKCFAEGGEVSNATPGNSAVLRKESSNQLDVENGGKTPLRPGFNRGGNLGKYLHKARGGKIDKKLAPEQRKKVSSSATGKPSPFAKKETGVLHKAIGGYAKGGKSYGGFNSKPLIGK